MSSLLILTDNQRTDKHTIHTYLHLYERLFTPKRTTATKVLEIGINLGGSIKLWKDWFTQAQIYGIDIMSRENMWAEIKNDPRITLYTSVDAYSNQFFESIDKDSKFDIIIDDGSHRLEDMKTYIKLYSSLLKDDGILIVEDVQSYDHMEILRTVVPEELKNFIYIYDLRFEKYRYDDLLFVIDKSTGKYFV